MPGIRSIQHHVQSGGTAYVFEDGWITERQGGEVYPIAAGMEIPATLNGTAEFQIYNALAATAAARAYGLSREHIRQALGCFRMEQHNRGRLNLFAFGSGYVLIDYAHNPEAMKAIQTTIAKWNTSRRTLVMAVPGDRRDDLIAESACAVAHGYQRIFIREDKDLRGRQPGEVAGLIEETIRRQNPRAEIHIVPDELEATIAAVSTMQPEEIVVACCDAVDDLTRWLQQQRAVPATDEQIQNLVGRPVAMTNAA